ncbi:MAG: nitroreductase family protein [Anaerolineae bacterium]|nr:nitroreductase family protein [Anaerolineae bacterium]
MGDISAEKLLTTTRSVRKRLDLTRAVPPEVIKECLQIAIQAPSGSNLQKWHFMVVTDADKRAQIGAWYKESFLQYADTGDGDIQQRRRHIRLLDSALHLAEHMHEVPALVIPCYEGRVEDAGQMAQAAHYGSILPAVWSFMMALRARGLGSAWTTLHLRYADEVAALLGIPSDVTQAALLPVACYTGSDFLPARRRAAREFTYWDSWSDTR